MPCLNAYAFAITSSTTAIMALMALSGVTLMSANIPDSVAQNMYRDISTIASNTGHALYDSANAILDFTADYSVKVANATGEMITVSGINLSNAISGFKNYLTAKNITGAYDGITISNYSNALNTAKMGEFNDSYYNSKTYTNVSTATNTILASQFQTYLSNVMIANKILVSTKNYYDMTVSGFKSNYATVQKFLTQGVNTWDNISTYYSDISSVYDLILSTFGQYTSSVTFDGLRVREQITNTFVDGSIVHTVTVLANGLLYGTFYKTATGEFIRCSLRSAEYDFDFEDAPFTVLPHAFYTYGTTGYSGAIAFNSSSGDLVLEAFRRYGTSTANFTSTTTISNIGYGYSDITYGDTVGFTSSAVAIPYVDDTLTGQDVYGVPDIPESVISGQYNTDVADRIGAVVGGADVIGLNVPVDTGADVYNPSIDALIGSGTLSSDVVIDGTTIATGTDVITGIDTAVGDLVSTGDTVLDLDTTPGTPGGTPSFPDVFPGLWDWVNNLIDNALQWFIFCGDVFGALPNAIKYTFLGGMTSVLAVGVIKKLLF